VTAGEESIFNMNPEQLAENEDDENQSVSKDKSTKKN
jgi:hypothetical protein